MDIREPAVDGTFYPDNPAELEHMVTQMLDGAKTPLQGDIRGIIVPHAGYIYSGQTAAQGFAQLEQQLRKIPKGQKLRFIILAPSHQVPFNYAARTNKTHYRTPLGDLPVVQTDKFEQLNEAHEHEHALEVELPFLQVVLKRTGHQAEILPLIIGQLNTYEKVETISFDVEELMDENTFLIISSDLSHYHTLARANEIDKESIKNILEFETHDIDACGYFPVLIGNDIARRNGWTPMQLAYDTSASASGQTGKVVGYAAIAYFDSGIDGDELVAFARKVIETKVKTGKTFDDPELQKKYMDKMGAFVTINKNNQLRGCIGYIEPVKPLYEAVRDNAVSAATKDPRFSAVTEDELDNIKVEVSVLTVPQKTTFEEIEQGDGVIIQKGLNSATFLPQVWEQLPDKDEFFAHLCQKAGLSADAYKIQKLEYKKYSALVFEED